MIMFIYLNVGKIIVSYSFFVASATNDRAGCNTAANTSAVRISCCKYGHTCCHHSFYNIFNAIKSKNYFNNMNNMSERKVFLKIYGERRK